MPSSTFTTAYGFEAKDIQPYILDRTRMREMVGASGLIDSLCTGFLDTVLESLKLEEGTHFVFCRRGGGGFTLLLEDVGTARRIQNLISLLIPQYAPGLRFVDAFAKKDSACASVQKVIEDLKVRVNAPAVSLPLAGPLVQRAQRTGAPATHWLYGEPVGRESRAKLGFAKQSDALPRKFDLENKYLWPVELNPTQLQEDEPNTLFPFVGDHSYIGILHIDGNGFGQALTSLRLAARDSPDYACIEYAFSQLIEDIGKTAAQRATTDVLQPIAEQTGVCPARPLILGGDDLTIILRADIALPFARSFIQFFEDASWRALQAYQARHGETSGLPERFTACAGLVFVRAKYPFYLAYQTCEELCERAKRISKAAARENKLSVAPSAIAFRRVTSRQEAGYGEHDQLLLEGTVYQLGGVRSDRIPALAALEVLTHFVSDPAKVQGKGVFRELHALLASDGAAKERYRRWKQVIASRSKQSLAEFEELLGQFGNAESELPIITAGSQKFSPIGDALALLAAQGGQEE